MSALFQPPRILEPDEPFFLPTTLPSEETTESRGEA
jgi:hypothetical protein